MNAHIKLIWDNFSPAPLKDESGFLKAIKPGLFDCDICIEKLQQMLL